MVKKYSNSLGPIADISIQALQPIILIADNFIHEDTQ